MLSSLLVTVVAFLPSHALADAPPPAVDAAAVAYNASCRKLSKAQLEIFKKLVTADQGVEKAMKSLTGLAHLFHDDTTVYGKKQLTMASFVVKGEGLKLGYLETFANILLGECSLVRTGDDPNAYVSKKKQPGLYKYVQGFCGPADTGLATRDRLHPDVTRDWGIYDDDGNVAIIQGWINQYDGLLNPETRQYMAPDKLVQLCRDFKAHKNIEDRVENLFVCVDAFVMNLADYDTDKQAYVRDGDGQMVPRDPKVMKPINACAAAYAAGKVVIDKTGRPTGPTPPPAPPAAPSGASGASGATGVTANGNGNGNGHGPVGPSGASAASGASSSLPKGPSGGGSPVYDQDFSNHPKSAVTPPPTNPHGVKGDLWSPAPFENQPTSNDPNAIPRCSDADKARFTKEAEEATGSALLAAQASLFTCAVADYLAAHSTAPVGVRQSLVVLEALSSNMAVAEQPSGGKGSSGDSVSLDKMSDFYDWETRTLKQLASQIDIPGSDELGKLAAFLDKGRTGTPFELYRSGYSIFNPGIELQKAFCPWKAAIDAAAPGTTALFPTQIMDCSQ